MYEKIGKFFTKQKSARHKHHNHLTLYLRPAASSGRSVASGGFYRSRRSSSSTEREEVLRMMSDRSSGAHSLCGAFEHRGLLRGDGGCLGEFAKSADFHGYQFVLRWVSMDGACGHLLLPIGDAEPASSLLQSRWTPPLSAPQAREQVIRCCRTLVH